MDKWQGNERRKGQGFWVVAFQWFSLIGWLLFTAALVISFYAAPEEEYGITRYKGIYIRDYWVSPLTDYLYWLLWATAAFSILTIVLSRVKSRRKTDNKYYNMVLLLIICLAWIFYIAKHAYWV